MSIASSLYFSYRSKTILIMTIGSVFKKQDAMNKLTLYKLVYKINTIYPDLSFTIRNLRVGITSGCLIKCTTG